MQVIETWTYVQVGKPFRYHDGKQDEADFLYALLASEPAQEFYSSLVFWDAKRPITTELLSALSLDKLAEELGRSSEYERYCSRNPWTAKQTAGATQWALFKD